MAKQLLPSAPVATRRDAVGGLVTVWGSNDNGTVDLSAPDGLWANGGGANPQPADGTTFAFTDDAFAPQIVAGREFIRVYVKRERDAVFGKKTVYRGGWVELSQVEYGGVGGGSDRLFVGDASGKPNEKAAETDAERILREFKEKYGSAYGTPTVIQDGATYSYKFANGKSLHMEEWEKLTEVDRRKFIDLIPANFREAGTGTNDNPSGNTPQKTLLYILGGGIVVVLVVLLVSRFRKK